MVPLPRLWSHEKIEKAKIELAVDEKGTPECRSGEFLLAWNNDS